MSVPNENLQRAEDGRATRVNSARRRALDVLPYLMLFAFSLAMTGLLLLADTPRLLHAGDTANVATFHSVLVDGNRFGTDYIYRNAGIVFGYQNYMLYLAAGMWGAARDIGTFWLGLQFFILFAMTAGFYRLARMASLPVVVAIAVAFACTIPIPTTIDDFWGALAEPYVRSVYAAIFPWLACLLVVAVRRDDVRWRIVPVVAAAVVGYIHFPSAPCGAMAILTASYAMKPARIGWPAWSALHIGFGLLCLVIWTPFMVEYARTYVAGQVSGGIRLSNLDVVSFDATDGLIESFWPYRAYGSALHAAVLSIVYLAGLAAILAGIRRDAPRRRLNRLLLAMIAGLLLSSYGLTLVDQVIAAARHRPPLQIDLIRGLRYVVPLLIFAAVVGAYDMAAPHRWRLAVPAAVLVLVGIQALSPLGSVSLPLRQLRLTRSTVAPDDRDAAALLRWLRAQPAGSTTLTLYTPMKFDLAVRYAARQPLGFSDKDQNILAHSGRGDVFRDWNDRRVLIEAFKDAPDRTTAWNALSERIGPRYVVLGRCPDADVRCARVAAFLEARYPVARENASFTILSTASPDRAGDPAARALPSG